jgi:transposase-like protein
MACGRSFTFARHKARPRARFADDVVQETVRIYVEGLTPYRALARLLEARLGQPVSARTLNRWVDDVGARAKTPLEVSIELRPRWGGFLGVDGKVIFIAGVKHWLLIGVDHPTQDIVHHLVASVENGDSYAQLVTEARLDAAYPLLGVVADLGNGFVHAHRDHFGSVPFQACRIHFDRRLNSEIPRLPRSPGAVLAAELRDRIRSVLYAPTYGASSELLNRLRLDQKKYEAVHRHRNPLRSLFRTWGLYMTHHLTPGLPADNNTTENVIKQLNKKLRLMEGFATRESADNFLRLVIGAYRFKRFTDSTRPEANGHAPLVSAGVDLSGRDWLTFLLDRARTH